MRKYFYLIIYKFICLSINLERKTDKFTFSEHQNFFKKIVRLCKMLNSTISYLRTIAKGRNIDCYKNMSKKQFRRHKTAKI